MSTLRVTGLKQETSSATNISMAVGGGVTVAGIATFHNNAIFTNDVTVTGNISVGGTLTYQDVTDVDSIGIITARAGVDITGGSLNIDGNVASTTQFSGFDALRIHNNNGSAFGVTADMYFTAGTSGSNRGAAIGSELVSGYGNDLYFATNGGNVSSTNTLTERLRITSGGNIGIGTDAPLSNALVEIQGGTGGQNTRLLFNSKPVRTTGSIGEIFFRNNDDSVAYIICGHDGANDAGNLTFATQVTGGSLTEKLRITSDGALNIGKGDETSSSANLVEMYVGATDEAYGTIRGKYNRGNEFNRSEVRFGVESNASGTGFLAFATGNNSATERFRITSNGQTRFVQNYTVVPAIAVNNTGGGTGRLLTFEFGGTVVGSINNNSSITAYNTSSDYRLKENVAPVTDGITRLQQLKPSRFNFIADADRTVDGFLAHEVQTIVPEAITGEKDAVDDEGNPEYQGIDKSKLVPLLTAALQEAISKIETLEQRLADAGIA